MKKMIRDNEDENSQTRPSHEDEVQNNKLRPSPIIIFKINLLACLLTLSLCLFM